MVYKFFISLKVIFFWNFLMTSPFGLKMAITFDGMVFLIWGRPSLESAEKYLSNGI